MSVHYRKGPDHHWMMTLLEATKHNWSRPPAANGPKRDSPGWVMTVFSAFFSSPFYCPFAPHLTSVATNLMPSSNPCSEHCMNPRLLSSSHLHELHNAVSHTVCPGCALGSRCCRQIRRIRGPYVWMSHASHAFPTQWNSVEVAGLTTSSLNCFPQIVSVQEVG